MFKLVQLGPLYTCSNLFILNCGQVAFDLNAFLLPPAKKLGQVNIFRSVCQEFCQEGHEWWGCTWQKGGMYGMGHAWLGGVCVVGGGICCRGACMAGAIIVMKTMHGMAWWGNAWQGVCAWQGCVCVVVGGRVWQGACMADTTRYGQWVGGTPSYWNAFLLNLCRVLLILSL